jgi:YidC/Oxa1 family membrane protein insertase
MNTSTQAVAVGLIELMTLTGSLGAAIIIFTIVLRSILLPLTLPSLKAQNKMRELKPEIDALKKKHGKDKKAFQQSQVELYQKYNVNPLAGCLPQLAQIAVLIVLYHALITFLGESVYNGVQLVTHFLWLDLTIPDKLFILPVIAGVSQLILSLMIAPGGEVKDTVPNDSKSKKVQKANEKEEDMAEMAASMQQQMIFIMPFMTVFIATQFPSGLALYWVITTIFSIIQQYFLSGPGGLVTYFERAKITISKVINK